MVMEFGSHQKVTAMKVNGLWIDNKEKEYIDIRPAFTKDSSFSLWKKERENKSLLMVINTLDNIFEEDPMVKENILGKMELIIKEILKMVSDKDMGNGVFL